MMDSHNVSLESLNAQLLEAEQKLAANEEAVRADTDATTSRSTTDSHPDVPSLLERLRTIDRDADRLRIQNELAGYGDCQNDPVEQLKILSRALCRFPSVVPIHQHLYRDEFLPLYDHVRSDLIHTLRQRLQQGGYPDQCKGLLLQTTASSQNIMRDIQECCQALQQITVLHKTTAQHMDEASYVEEGLHPVIVELCRPFTERIRYHFLTPSDRPTYTRTDRLPEWLLGYLKEHVFPVDGPWTVIDQELPQYRLDVLNEIMRMIQFVLSERNFFRHPTVVGESSRPLWLSKAVQELLQFDDLIKTRLLIDPSEHKRVVSLVDVCVAGDEELLAWWLQREKESVFETLFEQDLEPSTTFVSPRAELFCTVLRSIRIKCSVFSFSGPYWSAVASPMCVRFLDVIQDTNTELRKILTQRNISDETLRNNVIAWIELINGTSIAAEVLCDPSMSDEVNDDLEGFGRSLDRLRGALLEDFVTNLVEVVLMERTNLASYLMRCSHFLASGKEIEFAERLHDLSADLVDTRRILHVVLRACDGVKDNEYDTHKTIRDRLLSMISEKFLEVAIDLHGMTPDLRQQGCAAFCRDVESLFDVDGLPEHALRVLDIALFMKQESSHLGGMGGALCGLAGRPPPLTEAAFETDDRLFDEAISMVRAKGFKYLELADLFAVLNRRKDL